MLEQIITIVSGNEIWSSLTNNIDVLASVFNQYLSGANNLRIASIILMLLALILFLFLIIILYVKSIVSFLKSDNKSANKSESFFNQLDDDKENDELVKELELEKELEKELERELEQARVEKINKEKEENKSLLSQQEENRRNQDNIRADEVKKEREEEGIKKASAERASGIDLDWRKGKIQDFENASVGIAPEIMQYKQSKKTLPELLGLIVDMIGRGVDDLKIAQTLSYRNQGGNSEDEILQTIDAVKDFIALCINGKFEQVKANKQLPEESAALYHLAKEDPSLSLILMEALMDDSIERSAAVASNSKRDEMFLETSNYACTFGSLAALSDVHLATGSFELAIELAPQNVNAWSRIGDMYAKTESNNKAIWAYQNVINMADEEVYARQVANANGMLSKYYYDQGNSLQAAKLYNNSKQYYDSIGINRRLDKKEVEIIEIIEENKGKDIENTITKILGARDSRQYSYA